MDPKKLTDATKKWVEMGMLTYETLIPKLTQTYFPMSNQFYATVTSKSYKFYESNNRLLKIVQEHENLEIYRKAIKSYKNY